MSGAPVLFIGGLDSSGGAGVLRDAATATQLGASHRVAVTAVTAQSDKRVSAVHQVPPEVVADQIMIAAEAGLAAIKIGMLGWADTVMAVARHLPEVPLVLDPVICASSGRTLIDSAGLAALLTLLLPRTTVLTPNLPELAVLGAALGLGHEAAEGEVVAQLLARGCGAVLVKGGHGPDPAICEDRLYRASEPMRGFAAPRLPGSARGTGCTLASALVVGLAESRPLDEAVQSAKTLVLARIALQQV